MFKHIIKSELGTWYMYYVYKFCKRKLVNKKTEKTKTKKKSLTKIEHKGNLNNLHQGLKLVEC